MKIKRIHSVSRKREYLGVDINSRKLIRWELIKKRKRYRSYLQRVMDMVYAYGISNSGVSVSLFNREGMGESGKRISRIKPFGKGEREKKHSSAFISETGRKSGKESL